MMELKELKKFSDMVCLYSEVGEVKLWETESIDTITELSGAGQYDAIETLFDDEGYETADQMMLNYFGADAESLNVLADEYGYSRI